MMKRTFLLLIALVMVLGFTVQAHATLIDNSDGTVTQIRDDPTYGDGSTLMWLQDANTAGTAMTWADANTWIGSLNSSSYLGYTDWRLPDTLPVNGVSYDYTYTFDGSTDRGFNITSPNSEMAYMYYVELEYLGYYDTSGSGPQSGWGISNTSFFSSTLQPYDYWSGTEHAPDPTADAWYFSFYDGYQSGYTKNLSNYAWAVRPGDVSAVPEPGTLLLLGSGLVGLILSRKRLGRIRG